MSRFSKCLLALALAASVGSNGSDGVRILKKRRTNASETVGKAGDNLKVNWAKFAGASPSGRIPAAATTCDGKLYIFGGETDVKSDDPWTVNRYLGDLWVFTPSGGGRAAAGSWAQLSSGGGPAARVTSSMVCASGTLTLFGGIERLAPGKHESLGDVWSFNLRRKKWTLVQADSAAAGGPGLLAAHTATLTDMDQDSMVVYGGHHPTNGQKKEVWVYSLSGQTWTKNRPRFSPAARNFHTAVAVPGTAALRIWGGVNDNTVWQYDLSGNSWSHAGFAPPYASGRMGAHFEGRLWSFGGFEMQGSFPHYMNDLQYQNSYNNAFDVAPAVGEVPEGRCYAVVTGLDGGLWIYGGYRRPADEERLSSLWKGTIA